MIMLANPQAVPALMFHSVGLEKHPWAWSYISESLESFEAKIALFRQAGFNAVHWQDLYDHMAGRRVLPPKSILLTFDDGYLDNWVYVYPVLKKYGMKGTVFVSPDFVDPAPSPRPNLDDLESGRCSRAELQVPGFLSWAEMREMERSGVIDIQSHAMTHTWYFSGPKVAGFHRPYAVTPHPWLFWNARPDRKPYYLIEDQQEYLPWGCPILEHRKSLEVRRYLPDQEAVDRICRFVADGGGRAFFDRADGEASLRSFVLDAFGPSGLPGTYESDEQRNTRIEGELRQSKQMIEKNLDKTVDFICWPGGANDATVQEMAAAAGYKSWTLDSRSQLGKRNLPGTDASNIKRIGTNNSIEVRGKRFGQGGPRYQLWRVYEHQGSLAHSLLLKARKVLAWATSLGTSH